MGGAVSMGFNNDELIDNLMLEQYIKTSLVERVFRAVDRAEYFLPEARTNAYKDLAWKCGNLHLSAPCIYSQVMEGLCLSPGQSFLNLGSGTGYLSTMAGLILGSNGVNHGVELHEDVVQYALRKLEDFKKLSGAIDEFDFCEPKFIQGNCLCLTSDCNLYDRVYCGAACPEQFASYMQNFLKIGGILVMPLNDQLLQVKRTSETHWDVQTLLPVSFSSLVYPEGEEETLRMMDIEPHTLQTLCRTAIRNILRKNVEIEHPPKKRPLPVKPPKKKRMVRKLIAEDSSEDEAIVAERPAFSDNNQRRLVNLFVDSVFDSMETDTEEGENEAEPNERQVEAIIEHNARMEDNSQEPQPPQDNVESIRSLVLLDMFGNMLGEPWSSRDSNSTSNPTAEEPNSKRKNRSNLLLDGGEAAQAEPKRGKREKFDSGIGDDEIVETHSSESSESDSDEENDDEDDGFISCLRVGALSSSEGEEEAEVVVRDSYMYESSSSEHMRAKILELPLPTILKRYLNFYREF